MTSGNTAAGLADCPNRELLRAFAVGNLPDDVGESIAEHLGDCARCVVAWESLDDGADPLVSDLRGSIPAEAFFEATTRAVERLAATVGSLPVGGTGEVAEAPAGPDRLERLGDYRLLDKLGQGGMGTVYRAEQTRLGKVVAVKVLAPERLRDPRAVARFRREMKAVGSLEHPNIVQAYDAREEDGRLFLVMEYLDGIDLARLLRRLGPLPVAAACAVIRQAAAGLDYAYQAQGLVHRDVKPANLMFTADGGVKVLDRGLAHLAEGPTGDGLTGEGEGLGTADYMAPEQWLEGPSIRARIFTAWAAHSTTSWQGNP